MLKEGETMKLIALFLSCLLFQSLEAAQPSSPSSIRVVPVAPTPESDNVRIFWTFPKESQIVSQPVQLQMRLDGYPLATTSDFARRNEVFDDPEGQSVRVIVDEYPPLSIYVSVIDGLDNNNIYYSQKLAKMVPYDLDNGTHLIRAFPVRSFGESLKNAGCFVATVFYTGGFTFPIDLSAPFLTYNTPQGNLPYGKPVLLDFIVSNTELSKDGYKILMTLDGKTENFDKFYPPLHLWLKSRRSYA